MNFKFKRLYHRIFSIFLVIVLSVLSVPTSAVAKEGNEETLNISTSAPISESTIATDLSQEVIWPVVSNEEAMRREQLIQNGIDPDQPLQSNSTAQLFQGGEELEPLSSYAKVLDDGVYAIQSVANSGYFMKVEHPEWLAGYHIQQQSANASTILSSFNTRYLFKLTQHPDTGSYIIRPMYNNALSIEIVTFSDGSRPEVRTKDIQLDDAAVPYSDTYVLSASGSGFKMRKYGTTNCLAVNGLATNLTATFEIGDNLRWTFTKYTGAERNSAVMLYNSLPTVGQSTTLIPVIYSTRPGYNMPYLDMSQIPSTSYYISGPNEYGRFSLTPHDGPDWTFHIYVKNGAAASAPMVYASQQDFKITLPIDEGVYFINNVEYPNKYVQINNNNSMLDSGEIIELHKFYSYYYQKWEVEHVLDGYYKIISQYSGLELTAPTGYNNDVVTQTAPSSTNTHLWKFIKLSDGTYRISPKSNANCFMMAGDESSAADQDLEIRDLQSDSSDEWYLHKCSEYVFVTLDTIIYYDPDIPDSAAQIRQMFEEATNSFIPTFNIKFNVVAVVEASSLTCSPSCHALLRRDECPPECGSEILCSTLHHRSAERLLGTLNSSYRHVCRVVGYSVCRYDEKEKTKHAPKSGVAVIGGKDTVVADIIQNDLIYVFQHELTHNFGTEDHKKENNENIICVMDGYIDHWCETCSSIVRGKYRG